MDYKGYLNVEVVFKEFPNDLAIKTYINQYGNRIIDFQYIGNDDLTGANKKFMIVLTR